MPSGSDFKFHVSCKCLFKRCCANCADSKTAFRLWFLDEGQRCSIEKASATTFSLPKHSMEPQVELGYIIQLARLSVLQLTRTSLSCHNKMWQEIRLKRILWNIWLSTNAPVLILARMSYLLGILICPHLKVSTRDFRRCHKWSLNEIYLGTVIFHRFCQAAALM